MRPPEGRQDSSSQRSRGRASGTAVAAGSSVRGQRRNPGQCLLLKVRGIYMDPQTRGRAEVAMARKKVAGKSGVWGTPEPYMPYRGSSDPSSSIHRKQIIWKSPGFLPYATSHKYERFSASSGFSLHHLSSLLFFSRASCSGRASNGPVSVLP